MKTAITRLLKRRNTLECDVQEELSFHLDMVTREYVERGLSAAEAKAATLKRFGDVGKVRKQCVQISHRRRPLRRVIKACLIALAFVGFAIRLLSEDVAVGHIGGTLVAIAVAGRLLLYVRGLTSSSFVPTSKSSLNLD